MAQRTRSRSLSEQRSGQSDEKGPAARRRPRAAREAYFLYVERAAEGANAADGPLSSLWLALQPAFEALGQGIDAVEPPVPVQEERDGRVRRVGGKLLADLLLEILVGLQVLGSIVEGPREGRLRFRAPDEVEQLHPALGVRRALHEHPRLDLPVVGGLVPDHLEGGPVVDDRVAGAPVPDRDQVHLLVLDELLRLGAGGPPDLDVWLDAIQALERPLDIEGIGLLQVR